MTVEDIVVGREPDDLAKYGKKGTIFLGKHVVGEGFEFHLTNPVLMDILRPHIVLIVGKRGCLAGDTKIFTSNGFKDIKNFDPELDEVYSFNGKSFELEKAGLVKYNINEPLLKVTFKDGRTLKMTAEHPLLAYKEGKMFWKQAKDMKIGDLIVSTYNLPEISAKQENSIRLAQLLGFILDHTSIENYKNKIGFINTQKAIKLGYHRFWRRKRRMKTIYINEFLCCDEIVNMELENGEKEVYDLYVPKNHNFIANGIISHNSGKSYTGSVIAEEIMKQPPEVRDNLTCLLIDTMGIFWSMKAPNEMDLEALARWDLRPQGFPTQNIVPIGLTDFYDRTGITYDGTFAIRPSELSAGDWSLTFDINLYEPLGILLERTLKKLRGSDYTIDDIINEIEKDTKAEQKDKLALQNRFYAAQEWGIFSSKATPIESFLKPGIATVLDVSLQEWAVRNLMIGVLSREIYQARTAARREEELFVIGGEAIKKLPMTWIIIDEAHNFIPVKGETAASDALLTLVRQGRQPGISLVLITQRPNKIHEDAIAQSDLVISHRLTAKPDLDALGSVMQTYLLFDIKKSIEALPKTKGSALILDDNSERLFTIQVRPRHSWHAGGSPIAIKEKT